MSRGTIYVGSGRYGPQKYRGQDVTGALALVRRLLPEAWNRLPLEGRPGTDREAASFFFKTDRSGMNMEEFIAKLEEHV